MSSAKGSGAGRTRGQAYQNRTAFRHNKGSKTTAKILASANSGGLCKRCADKIEWRIKYRKYKPLTQPGLCNGCNCRNVKAAYRTLCESCAKKREACPQCAKVNEALTPKVQTKAEEAREYEYLEGVVETLRERDRRTVYRKVARGEDVLAPLVAGSDDSSEDEDASADEDEDNSDSGSDDCGASDGCASDTSGAVVEGSGGAAVEGDCAKSDDFRLECSLSRDISEVLQL